jgi:hypothetical protein
VVETELAKLQEQNKRLINQLSEKEELITNLMAEVTFIFPNGLTIELAN